MLGATCVIFHADSFVEQRKVIAIQETIHACSEILSINREQGELEQPAARPGVRRSREILSSTRSAIRSPLSFFLFARPAYVRFLLSASARQNAVEGNRPISIATAARKVGARASGRERKRDDG